MDAQPQESEPATRMKEASTAAETVSSESVKKGWRIPLLARHKPPVDKDGKVIAGRFRSLTAEEVRMFEEPRVEPSQTQFPAAKNPAVPLTAEEMYQRHPAYARIHLTQLLLRTRPEVQLSTEGQPPTRLHKPFWYKYVAAVSTAKHQTAAPATAREPCYLRSQAESYRQYVSDEMPGNDDVFFTVCFANAEQRYSIPEEFTVWHPNFNRMVIPVEDGRNRVLLVYTPARPARMARRLPVEFLEEMATIHTGLAILVSWDEIRAVAPSSRLAMSIAHLLVTPQQYAARNLYVWCCAAQNAVCAGTRISQADYESGVVPHDAIKALYVGPIIASALCEVAESERSNSDTTMVTPYHIWATAIRSWWKPLLTDSAGRPNLGSFSEGQPYGLTPTTAEQMTTPSLRRLTGAVEALYTMADRRKAELSTSLPDATDKGERALKRSWTEMLANLPTANVYLHVFFFRCYEIFNKSILYLDDSHISSGRVLRTVRPLNSDFAPRNNGRADSTCMQERHPD